MLARSGQAEWLEVVRASPEASFFHTPHWARVAAAAGGWEPAALIGRLDDGARVVYPLVAEPRRRLRGLAPGWSSWAGCYGGPIAERALRPDETAALHAQAAARHPVDLRVVLGPATAALPVPAGWETRPDVTFHVPLEEGADAVVAGLHEGHRRAFRRGEREGLTVRPAAGAGDHAEYLAMYDETLARWGDRASSRYGAEVFAALAAIEREDPSLARLWMAEHDGRAVAGTWSLAWGDTIVLWHAAARDVRIPMSSPQITLYATIMCDAAERGLRRLDFNPSGGHEGATAFKRRFGAVERPVLRARAGRPAARRARRIVDALHRRLR